MSGLTRVVSVGENIGKDEDMAPLTIQHVGIHVRNIEEEASRRKSDQHRE
jgi:hypothetical protein